MLAHRWVNAGVGASGAPLAGQIEYWLLAVGPWDSRAVSDHWWVALVLTQLAVGFGVS